jgi:hypothetical protein
MQQEETRLRRDRHPNFVGDFLSRAALETFFRQKNLNVLEQLSLIRDRKPHEERDPGFNDLQPFVRKRPRLQPFPMSIFEETEHYESCRGACPHAQRFSTAAEDSRLYDRNSRSH